MKNKAMKPILFNTEMVQAILNGKKTTTRRIIKNNPTQCASKVVNGVCKICDDKGGFYLPDDYIKARSPYQIGDILYVRETFCKGSLDYGKEQYYYKADNIIPHCEWHPSIHMPKDAARLFLRVTNVKVERLHNVNTYAVYREGISECNVCPECVGSCDECWRDDSPLRKFEQLWDSTVKKSDLLKYGWAADPLVWVIEFETIDKDKLSNII